MKKKPIVSVAVPNLNQGKYLDCALSSIINQKGISISIAVLDAGSTDNSTQVIEKFVSRIDYHRSFPDKGQAAAINEGINALGDSDYVAWLNADDVYMMDGLQKMVNYLENNEGVIAVYGEAHIINENGEILGDYPTRRFSIDQLRRECFICQPATLIRGEAWRKVLGLDESYHMCMDYDLWWRISRIGQIGYLDEVVACSRDHDKTKSRNNQRVHFEEAFKMFKKHQGYVPLHWCMSYSKEVALRSNQNTFLKVCQRVLGWCYYLKYRL